MDYKELVELSIKAQKFSYSPYSKITVGAALLTAGGKVYTGCNIENASYGATNCAERTALFKAASEGEREFTAMAITSNLEGVIYPCGICRQVMSELSPDIDVILSDRKSEPQIIKLKDLIPNKFSL